MLTIKKYKGIFFTILSIIALALYFGNLFIPKKDIQTQIEELRNKTQPRLDSTVNAIAAENRFFDSLNYLITYGHYERADKVISQLLEKSPRNDQYWTLKGKWFDAQKMYDSALYYYNFAIILQATPYNLEQRARTHIKMKNYEEAIQDYRKAYQQNYDYSYKLAFVFEHNKQKDSALKYYYIYLEHYPDSTYNDNSIYPPDSIKVRIKKLNNQ